MCYVQYSRWILVIQFRYSKKLKRMQDFFYECSNIVDYIYTAGTTAKAAGAPAHVRLGWRTGPEIRTHAVGLMHSLALPNFLGLGRTMWLPASSDLDFGCFEREVKLWDSFNKAPIHGLHYRYSIFLLLFCRQEFKDQNLFCGINGTRLLILVQLPKISNERDIASIAIGKYGVLIWDV